MPQKIRVYKVREYQALGHFSLHDLRNMWQAHCPCCAKSWQYWDFGATLGSVLEHIRRHHRTGSK